MWNGVALYLGAYRDIVSVYSSAAPVGRTVPERFPVTGIAPVRHLNGTLQPICGDASASLPPRLDKRYVIHSFHTTLLYGIVRKYEVY